MPEIKKVVSTLMYPKDRLEEVREIFAGSDFVQVSISDSETRVNRFRDEVFRTETKVVNMISLVHNIGYRLFCQVGNGMYGGNLHFFVDGFGPASGDESILSGKAAFPVLTYRYHMEGQGHDPFP